MDFGGEGNPSGLLMLLPCYVPFGSKSWIFKNLERPFFFIKNLERPKWFQKKLEKGVISRELCLKISGIYPLITFAEDGRMVRRTSAPVPGEVFGGFFQRPVLFVKFCWLLLASGAI